MTVEAALAVPALRLSVELVWCVTNTFNYFRVFRRHAALLVGAIEELCLLLAPCLTTKSIGNIVQLIYDTPH